MSACDVIIEWGAGSGGTQEDVFELCKLHVPAGMYRTYTLRKTYPNCTCGYGQM